MKKNPMILAAVFALMIMPVLAIAGEGPMALPDGANPEAVQHNKEGMDQWGQGQYEVALKHFHMASSIDPSLAEAHFNEAICLDKMGQHGKATMHFKAAKKNARGNKKILGSPILNAHLGL